LNHPGFFDLPFSPAWILVIIFLPVADMALRRQNWGLGCPRDLPLPGCLHSSYLHLTSSFACLSLQRNGSNRLEGRWIGLPIGLHGCNC
jgi:hypothetical protein